MKAIFLLPNFILALPAGYNRSTFYVVVEEEGRGRGLGEREALASDAVSVAQAVRRRRFEALTSAILFHRCVCLYDSASTLFHGSTVTSLSLHTFFFCTLADSSP